MRDLEAQTDRSGVDPDLSHVAQRPSLIKARFVGLFYLCLGFTFVFLPICHHIMVMTIKPCLYFRINNSVLTT